MVDACEERCGRADEARRAGRLDVWLLRRMGAELLVLHRSYTQRDRPLLRGAELWPGQRHGERWCGCDTRMVPPEPRAADNQVGTAREYKHSGICDPVRTELRREEQGHIPAG